MSDKPSLYVVEKKEVVILVVLFVLVTVLSFTLGVRYGESVGKKTAHEQELAAKEHGEAVGDSGSGTLGKSGNQSEHGEAAHGETKQEEHGESKHGDTAAHGEHAAAGTEHDAPHGTKPESKGEAKGEEHSEAKAHESHSPESAAKASSQGSESVSREAVDKNSDEYLLNALKDAGVESPGGKAPKNSKLPEEVKEAPRHSRILGGSYVIQVGSHPTRSEAEAQVRTLKSRRVNADILPPFKDKQGEWHRVVIGSYKNKREADKEASGLKGKGSIVSFFVWRLP